jgi:D-alanine-D-alanine ligase
VRKALEKSGHAARLVPLGEDIAAFIDALRQPLPDVVFNLCEGLWGDSRQEMNVAGLFELLGLPYSGSAPVCLGLTQDKARTKDLLMRHHLPTPNYIVARPGQQVFRTRELTFPLIVKPRYEDASLGISPRSIVASEQELRERVAYIHALYHQEALVEDFIDGREFNVAVLDGERLEVLPVAEILFEQGLAQPIVSYNGKWLESSEEFIRTRPVCPAAITVKEEILIKDLALRTFKLLECRDYARIDIRYREGIPYILEVNANPDICPDAGLARAARVAGLSYAALVERIVDAAARRRRKPHA